MGMKSLKIKIWQKEEFNRLIEEMGITAAWVRNFENEVHYNLHATIEQTNKIKLLLNQVK